MTHGMPCVNMHGSFEAYIRGLKWAVLTTKRAASFSPWEHQGEGGGREKEKGRKGEEKGRKVKKKGEEMKGERKKEKIRKKGRMRGKRKRKKEGVLHSEQTRTAKNLELSYKR